MSQSQDIVTEVAHGVRTIRLNRPKVKNAIDSDMFMMIANLLNQDANNDEVKLVIITGMHCIFMYAIAIFLYIF